ncbi:unnamed protein product [Linum tenue]|uniref:beta-glucosidase n=1 Tax=Linum tenue TaxID=586396 RepID=A0AAV0N1R3_9ROSI|nr:unnamed protein product [Linum tenue]
MGRMTLAEKVGQMTQIDRVVATHDVMKKYFIGKSIRRNDPMKVNNASAARWVTTVNKIQEAALSTRLGIPMLFGVDAVHGHSYMYRSTIFPHNIGLGATRDVDLIKRIGAATAAECTATGVRYVFSPTIAVCRDPRWGRCYESFSEDPELVKNMTAIISGLQGQVVPSNSRKGVPFFANDKTKVAACAKHYVGDGGTNKGINENDTVLPWSELVRIHMLPYVGAIEKGVATVMVSYSSVNGTKMHANRDLITGYLKNKLKFRGFVISDMMGIDKITTPIGDNYTYSIEAGIGAGIDMVMVPYNTTSFVNGLTRLVNEGFIPMSRVDDAVSRILRVKFAMGLFEAPLADSTSRNKVGNNEHRRLAREAVRKSLVLLKNGHDSSPVLPLPKKAPLILVAGSHANNLGFQCGGWSMRWQGFNGSNVTSGTTILEAVRRTVDPTTQVVFSQQPDQELATLNNFSHAIVVVGEPPYAESKGQSSNLTLPADGLAAIESVCGRKRRSKCVVVLVTGRPVAIEPELLARIDALVAAWLPGTEGRGVTDVLFGDHGFTGKLPRTWFRSVDQLPMNVGDEVYDPLFPFGFGLAT